MIRILLIEDDEDVRVMIKDRFERDNFEVVEATDGAAGLALYRETEYHLVITDLIMPQMEGIETINKLREYDPDVKIIAISGGGRADPEVYLNIAKCMGAGRIFSKPVDWDELLQAVRDLTELSI